MTNSLAKLLQGTFYPKFLPKCSVNKFFISGWKVSVLNYQPNKALLRRLSDNYQEAVTEQEIQNKFLYQDDYLKFAEQNGYLLEKKEDHLLYFIPSYK